MQQRTPIRAVQPALRRTPFDHPNLCWSFCLPLGKVAVRPHGAAGVNVAKPADVPSLYRAAWQLVRQIPPGRVMTYGQIATLLGTPRAARAVGYSMFFVRGADVPWQRVVNAKGQISLGGDVDRPALQRELLLAEGIEFSTEGRIDLAARLWWPDPQLWRTPAIVDPNRYP